MTQQPYPPQYPQQPGQAQQPAPPYPPQQPSYPPQTYGGQPVGPYPHQQTYPPQYQQPAAPPSQPLAKGTLADFYEQPQGGAKAISYKDVPDGTTWELDVQRDVSNSDVSQQTGAPGSPQAGQPLTYRDGRPKFALAIPVTLQHPAHPDGEARLFVQGQMQGELARAMAEAGVTDPQPMPKRGDHITLTLVHRKALSVGRQNIFAIRYYRADQSAPRSSVQMPNTPPVASQQQAPPPQQPYDAQPQQYAPPAPPQAQGQPAPQAQAPNPPPGISQEQAAVLARLTAGAQQPQG